MNIAILGIKIHIRIFCSLFNSSTSSPSGEGAAAIPQHAEACENFLLEMFPLNQVPGAADKYQYKRGKNSSSYSYCKFSAVSEIFSEHVISIADNINAGV